MNHEGRPIIFEGVPLPLGVYWLELLTYIVPTASEDARNWALDLHYSLGKNREASSSLIQTHIEELKKLLKENRELVAIELKKRLPDNDPESLIKEWDEGMTVMAQIARFYPKCSWSMPATKEEEAKSGDALINFLNAFATAQKITGLERQKFEELKDKIQSAASCDRMKMLHAALDSLNKNDA